MPHGPAPNCSTASDADVRERQRRHALTATGSGRRAPGLLVVGAEVLQVRAHLDLGRVRRPPASIASRIVVRGALIARWKRCAERRTREVRLQHREDGLRGDLEQRVAAGLDDAVVELRVVDELLLRVEPTASPGSSRAQPLEVLLAAPLRRRAGPPGTSSSSRASSSSSSVTCRGLGEQIDARAQERRDVVDAWAASRSCRRRRPSRSGSGSGRRARAAPRAPSLG